MLEVKDYRPITCAECLDGAGLDFEITMAYQPIVDVETRSIFSYEALVRGPAGESAGEILGRVNGDNRYHFDQACRVKAIQVATRLGLPGRLNINFLPRAVYRPELCIRTTLEASAAYGLPVNRIIFEVTEGERVEEHSHLRDIIREYQRLGFTTAIDDFGAGYSGLSLLAEFQPDFVKLDIALTRDVANNKARRAIVRGVIAVCRDLEIQIIAEGIEARDELNFLRNEGIRLFQGYYFARPGFEQLPEVADEVY